MAAPLEALLAASPRARAAVVRFALAWRQGEDPRQRRSLVLGMSCPYCRKGLIVVTARTQTIPTITQFLLDAGGCLHLTESWPAGDGRCAYRVT